VSFWFVQKLPALLALLVGLAVAPFGDQFDAGEAYLSLSQSVLIWP
jgi:hypothetical protein